MSIEFGLDWSLGPSAFSALIDQLIHDAVQEDCVLPLMFSFDSAVNSISVIALINASISCKDCEAQCCQSNPKGEPLGLCQEDVKQLTETYGEQFTERFTPNEEGGTLPMPCPFYSFWSTDEKETHCHCAIYSNRPLACRVYPFDMPATVDGESVLALSSRCPEARRLVKQYYMVMYGLRHPLQAAHEQILATGGG